MSATKYVYHLNTHNFLRFVNVAHSSYSHNNNNNNNGMQSFFFLLFSYRDRPSISPLKLLGRFPFAWHVCQQLGFFFFVGTFFFNHFLSVLVRKQQQQQRHEANRNKRPTNREWVLNVMQKRMNERTKKKYNNNTQSCINTHTGKQHTHKHTHIVQSMQENVALYRDVISYQIDRKTEIIVDDLHFV